MIDWITAEVRCNNKLDTGCLAKINPMGEVDWVSQSWLPVTGSYESNIMIKPLTDTRIVISGNPAKFLQGHNLFGTNDLVYLFNKAFGVIHELLADDGLTPTASQLDDIENGNYHLTRVDINETWHLKDGNEVRAWIRSAGEKMNMPYRGKGVFSGDTLYWGKGSKYWFMKCYHKGGEILRKKSNFPDDLKIPEMLEYADKSLRLELVLCSKFLRSTTLNNADLWNEKTAKMLLLEYIKKLEMSDNFMISDDVLASLPNKLKTYYLLWLHGEDVRKHVSKPTFYRIRKQLKEYGIDIALLRDKEHQESNVIPLIKVLEAEPVGIPAWAYEKGLVA
ncbi:phage/plasmid replication protein, II/X family [Moraxella pluranimalium]|uniref:Alpha/beta hydrolase n=1 Tax=Moraxella pluranimalium TaxID=470453 RepID=A0A1T0CGN7_9GAMM|nr:phage/plasmid replication protein, II/X family [Moraxella pluranimalium]OOS21522.1 alpha/beta hydrolase [Moraxella pluranimalium]